jgi:hypothetical protein
MGKHVDAAEVRIVFAAVLAAAADAVLVAHDFLKLGGHLVAVCLLFRKSCISWYQNRRAARDINQKYQKYQKVLNSKKATAHLFQLPL